MIRREFRKAILKYCIGRSIWEESQSLCHLRWKATFDSCTDSWKSMIIGFPQRKDQRTAVDCEEQEGELGWFCEGPSASCLGKSTFHGPVKCHHTDTLQHNNTEPKTSSPHWREMPQYHTNQICPTRPRTTAWGGGLASDTWAWLSSTFRCESSTWAAKLAMEVISLGHLYSIYIPVPPGNCVTLCKLLLLPMVSLHLTDRSGTVCTTLGMGAGTGAQSILLPKQCSSNWVILSLRWSPFNLTYHSWASSGPESLEG